MLKKRIFIEPWRLPELETWLKDMSLQGKKAIKVLHDQWIIFEIEEYTNINFCTVRCNQEDKENNIKKYNENGWQWIGEYKSTQIFYNLEDHPKFLKLEKKQMLIKKIHNSLIMEAIKIIIFCVLIPILFAICFFYLPIIPSVVYTTFFYCLCIINMLVKAIEKFIIGYKRIDLLINSKELEHEASWRKLYLHYLIDKILYFFIWPWIFYFIYYVLVSG